MNPCAQYHNQNQNTFKPTPLQPIYIVNIYWYIQSCNFKKADAVTLMKTGRENTQATWNLILKFVLNKTMFAAQLQLALSVSSSPCYLGSTKIVTRSWELISLVSSSPVLRGPERLRALTGKLIMKYKPTLWVQHNQDPRDQTGSWWQLTNLTNAFSIHIGQTQNMSPGCRVLS